MVRKFGTVPLWPKHVQCVGNMRDMKADVAAVCEKCRTKFKVDLEALVQLRGRSYSLIDKRGPCRRYECDGLAFFVWSPGRGVPFRALTTDEGASRPGGRPSTFDDDTPPDDEPPKRPPPVPLGIDPEAWAVADERERKRLLRQARG